MEPELKDLFEKIFVEKKSRIDIKHLKMHPWIKSYFILTQNTENIKR